MRKTYHPGNILFQTMLVNSDVLLVPNILDPLAIFRNWRSQIKSLRILRRVANEYEHLEIMLSFSGITLQQNILKISELLSDLWWMDKRQYSALCNPCLKRMPLPS
jgi:hypothetical protein